MDVLPLSYLLRAACDEGLNVAIVGRMLSRGELIATLRVTLAPIGQCVKEIPSVGFQIEGHNLLEITKREAGAVAEHKDVIAIVDDLVAKEIVLVSLYLQFAFEDLLPDHCTQIQAVHIANAFDGLWLTNRIEMLVVNDSSLAVICLRHISSHPKALQPTGNSSGRIFLSLGNRFASAKHIQFVRYLVYFGCHHEATE